MKEYPNYYLSDNFVDFVEVKGQRLYFEPFKETETIETITEQYSRLNPGKVLDLTVDSRIKKGMSFI